MAMICTRGSSGTLYTKDTLWRRRNNNIGLRNERGDESIVHVTFQVNIGGNLPKGMQTPGISASIARSCRGSGQLQGKADEDCEES